MTGMLAILSVVPVGRLPAQSTFPTDSAIRGMLAGRMGEGGSAGVVIGLLEPDGRTRFIAAGDAGPGRMLSKQSVFEIGSITKVFTGTLLADMVQRGEVALADPVAKYLPAGVQMPGRGDKVITLANLAQQNSGLPRLPSNLRPANPLNPYADYTADKLYEFLNGHSLTRDPGETFEYSNLAVGLLGHVLALRAGTSYEELVRQRILQPLEMTSTAVTLTPELRARLVAGHNAGGDTVPGWDLPVLAGAGALRSTGADMLRFAEAALRGHGAAPEAIRAAMQPRAPAGGMTIGLLWLRRADTVTAAGVQTVGDTIVWHNGGTGGFRTFIGLMPKSGRAVVVLANSGGSGLDDVGFHLLDPRIPLGPAPRRSVPQPPEVLQRYPGTYQLAPQFSIVVTLENGALMATPTNQPAVRLWPASATEFFIREVDAQVTFKLGDKGEVTGLVLHQNGRDLPGAKVQ